jgi:hypothetical protein
MTTSLRSLALRATRTAFAVLALGIGAVACGGSDGPPRGNATCTNDASCGAQKCDVVAQRCVDCLSPTDCPNAGDRCEQNVCIAAPRCERSSDCTAPQVCDTSAGACVGCLTSFDCGTEAECIAQQCVPFQACRNTRDCKNDLVCDAALGRCVECVDDADCPEGQACGDSICRPACESDRQCSALGLLCDKAGGYCVECLGDADCSESQFCGKGACIADVCEGNTTRCTDNDVERCEASGRGWLLQEPCFVNQTCAALQGGSSVACLPWACNPDAVACDQPTNTLRQCATDGLTSALVDDCGAKNLTCDDAVCKARVCEAGGLFCSGQDLRLCSSTGATSRVQTTCPPNQYCNETSLRCQFRICIPDAPVCNGDVATLCNSNGSGYVGAGTQCTATQTCANGACRDRVCSPSTYYCDGVLGDVRLCAADGLSSTVNRDCDANQFCDQSSGFGTCRNQLCAPNQPACDGNRATTCNAMGSGYASGGTACSTNQTCVAGVCQDQVCTPYASFCSASLGEVRRCSADGLSSTLSSNCAGSSYYCDASVSPPVCRYQICTPDQPVCNGNSATRCNASGSGYSGTTTPCSTNQTCVSGACRDQICTPNRVYCDSVTNDVRSCSSDGLSSYLYSDCSSTQWCDASVSTPVCRAQVCRPGDAVCGGSRATTCNAAGSGPSAGGTECGAQACLNGACVSSLFFENWEDLDFAGWAPIGVSSFSRGVPSTGGAAGSSAFFRQLRTNGPVTPEGVVRQFANLPASSVSWWARSSTQSEGTLTRIFADAGGNVELFSHSLANGQGTLNYGTGFRAAPYTTNTWALIELRNINWTARSFDYYLDQQLVLLGARFGGTGTGINRIELAVPTQSVNSDWDQFIIR